MMEMKIITFLKRFKQQKQKLPSLEWILSVFAWISFCLLTK